MSVRFDSRNQAVAALRQDDGAAQAFPAVSAPFQWTFGQVEAQGVRSAILAEAAPQTRLVAGNDLDTFYRVHGFWTGDPDTEGVYELQARVNGALSPIAGSTEQRVIAGSDPGIFNLAIGGILRLSPGDAIELFFVGPALSVVNQINVLLMAEPVFISSAAPVTPPGVFG